MDGASVETVKEYLKIPLKIPKILEMLLPSIREKNKNISIIALNRLLITIFRSHIKVVIIL